VRERVNFEHELVAAKARYHRSCLGTFNKYNPTSLKKGRPQDESVKLEKNEKLETRK